MAYLPKRSYCRLKIGANFCDFAVRLSRASILKMKFKATLPAKLPKTLGKLNALIKPFKRKDKVFMSD